MTVQPATQMWSKNTTNSVSNDFKDFAYTAGQGWQVVHDPTDTREQIEDALNLPKVGDLLPGTETVRCSSVVGNQVGPVLTIFDVKYAGVVGEGGSSLGPTSNFLQYEWGKVDASEPADEDINGEPIVTVNNESIEGIVRPLSDLVLKIDQTYDFIDVPATQAYLQSVSSDVFPPASAGIGTTQPGQARMTEFSAKQATGVVGVPGSAQYFNVHAEIQFRLPYNTTAAKAWHARTLHKGFKVIVGGRIVDARDGDQNTTGRPVLLKADGTQEKVKANANWLEFPMLNPLPYNALGFRWP